MTHRLLTKSRHLSTSPSSGELLTIGNFVHSARSGVLPFFEVSNFLNFIKNILYKFIHCSHFQCGLLHFEQRFLKNPSAMSRNLMPASIKLQRIIKSMITTDNQIGRLSLSSLLSKLLLHGKMLTVYLVRYKPCLPTQKSTRTLFLSQKCLM